MTLRAEIVARRTYNRPLDAKGVVYETWEQTIDRVERHQRWLWERAQGQDLSEAQMAELQQLGLLMRRHKGSLSGRTLWLGGTEIARTVEGSSFNCTGLRVKTVFDVVDVVWLLLQGSGVGFVPVEGVLNGFCRPIPAVQVIRSTRTTKGGAEANTETWLPGTKTWIIQVGDSATSWAKALGKLIAGKYPAQTLVLDLSQIRPAGERLRGYGWISSGDHQLALALEGIARVLNTAAGRLLTAIEILDILNWAGTILSSRRSAELALLDAEHPQWEEFATAKQDHFTENPQRAQSNNSLVFYEKPSKQELLRVFELLAQGGGSEPGIVNGAAAKRRAPDFAALNPCAEALLGDKSLCNLAEINLSRFNGAFVDLLEAAWTLARANYRQTCVDLRDGVLQHTWHELNQYLHLCGVGLTGYVQWEYQGHPDRLRAVYRAVRDGTNSMADELGLPYAKRVTLVKPSGTLSKVMDCTEGVHKPIGKYLFNNINFSKFDPLVYELRRAGYYIFENPYDSTGVLVRFPVKWEGIDFTDVDGVFVNTESALDQLERYRVLMENYVDHNVSITVSYSPEEVPEIVDWLLLHWDLYVAAAFMYRQDYTKSAKDLGYPYLPQEVVRQADFDAYVAQLGPVSIGVYGITDTEDECASGGCPVR